VIAMRRLAASALFVATKGRHEHAVAGGSNPKK